MKPVRLISGFITVGGWTLASRILGFAREIMITALIGPGPLMDAFVAAFRLPNMFRRFFAEGAFNAAFVPMYASRYEGGEDADGFAQTAFNGLAFAVLLLTALSMVFMPALVWATAGGFAGDARFDLTVGYGRIVFPYILFMSLAALFSGVLNAHGRFAAAAAAPVLLNIFVVTAMAVASFIGGEVILWLIWTIPVAGIAQLALVWSAASRAGVHLRPGRPRWTPEMKHLVAIGIPAALSNGVMQINLVVGQLVASDTESAVSWLFAADRLYQLPLGVVGIAVGIVLLPELSRRLRADDTDGARAAYSRAGEFALTLTVPSAIAFLVIPLPLVSVMYERGATGPDDVANIALAVTIYGLGLPAFMLQKLQQPLFYAREDTRTPFRYAIWAMVINAAVAIGLAPVLGWIAPALATTLSAWAMVVMLTLGARRFGEAARFDDRMKRRLWRIVVASVLMGAGLWGAQALFAGVFALPFWRYIALLALIAFGAVIYFGAGHLIGAFRLSDFKSAVKRGKAS